MNGNSYERINDLVYIVSDEVKLILSVILASRSNKTNIKYHYHQEYEYNKGGEQVISIKREGVATLNFKSSVHRGINDDISIGPQHFERFYDTLEQCKDWFNGKCQVFCRRDGKLFITRNNPEARPKIVGELFNNKWIAFEPIVIIGDNDMSSPGIRMDFNNQYKADVMVDRFYGLLHVLRGFNMYTAMSILLNYVNTCTPGTNLMQMSVGPNQNQPEEGVVGVNRRSNYSSLSFFDKQQ